MSISTTYITSYTRFQLSGIHFGTMKNMGHLRCPCHCVILMFPSELPLTFI